MTPPRQCARQPPRLIRYKAPVEVMEGASPARLRSVATAIAAATITAALLGSGALLGWATALPVGPASDHLVDLAQEWHDAMEKLGMTEFENAVTALLRLLESAR